MDFVCSSYAPTFVIQLCYDEFLGIRYVRDLKWFISWSRSTDQDV